MGNCRDAPIDQCDQPWLVTCRSLRDLRFCSNHTHRNRHSAVSVYLLHLVLFAEVQILPFTSSWRFEKRERNRTCKTLLQFIITWKKSYKNVCVCCQLQLLEIKKIWIAHNWNQLVGLQKHRTRPRTLQFVLVVLRVGSRDMHEPFLASFLSEL